MAFRETNDRLYVEGSRFDAPRTNGGVAVCSARGGLLYPLKPVEKSTAILNDELGH